jgi:hypothetical protein
MNDPLQSDSGDEQDESQKDKGDGSQIEAQISHDELRGLKADSHAVPIRSVEYSTDTRELEPAEEEMLWQAASQVLEILLEPPSKLAQRIITRRSRETPNYAQREMPTDLRILQDLPNDQPILELKPSDGFSMEVRSTGFSPPIADSNMRVSLATLWALLADKLQLQSTTELKQTWKSIFSELESQLTKVKNRKPPAAKSDIVRDLLFDDLPTRLRKQIEVEQKFSSMEQLEFAQLINLFSQLDTCTDKDLELLKDRYPELPTGRGTRKSDRVLYITFHEIRQSNAFQRSRHGHFDVESMLVSPSPDSIAFPEMTSKAAQRTQGTDENLANMLNAFDAIREFMWNINSNRKSHWYQIAFSALEEFFNRTIPLEKYRS